jgi:uncharacterized protein DUF2752
MLERPQTGRHPQVLTGLALLGAVGLVAAVDPHTAGRYPLCPWHAMTGTWCPGCGGLRAVHDLAHGQLLTAASENLLVVVLLPVVAMWWRTTRRRRSGSQRSALALGPRSTVAVTLVALAFAVLRNLPLGAGLAP